ncbi:MAG: Gfo/Idh/MocA family oxidoreductase, partial [Proteobacteria bacterium]|nr:Gfo/Idh/MocA family oxidoreductase [Pseudomonadota bacterium]
MNVAIIGCGLIGRKRSETLAGSRLVACADLAFEQAEALARKFPGCQPLQDWRSVLDRKDVDIIVVA